MSALAINNVFYIVGDNERARRFYEEALGLELVFTDGSKWTQMKLGGAKLALSSAAEAGREAAGATVVFEIDDIYRTKADIVEAGGVMLRERDMGTHGHLLIAQDTEGNVIHLLKRHRS